MNATTRHPFTAVCAALLMGAWISSAMAVPWDGGGPGGPPDGDGLWTTGANWNPDVVPSGVSAEINLNGADVVLNNGSTQTIAGLQIGVPNNVTATLGVSNNSVINVNGGLSMATGGTGSNAGLTMTNATFNGVSGGEWVRRGGTATVTMTNSTINASNGLAWAGANAPEGADTLNLSMTNSRINLSSGNLSIGNARNDQKTIFTTFDATSQININAGGIFLNGGNPSGPSGQAVYNLPLSATTANPGKIFALNGVNAVATGNNAKVTLTLDAAGTVGVKQSDPVLNWNNNGLSIATGGSGSVGIVNLTGITINNMGGSEWARRGGTATVNMVNSTINAISSLAWAGANAPEGADTFNLSMTNSKINISSGNLSIGNARNDQKAFFTTFDATSQININAGGIFLNGGNPGGPSGQAVYNLPLSATTANPGKIFALNGVNAVATGNNAKVTLTLDAAGTVGVKQSDPVLNWNNNGLSIATGGSGSVGIVNLTGITINNMGGSEWARRGGTATVNMTNSTINGSGNLAWAGGNAAEGADTFNLSMTNSVINRTTGSIIIANNHNNQKAVIGLDGTSQINLSAGGISIAGGNTSFAGDVDTPAGTAVYTLPLAAAPNTNGKIYAHTGINSVGEQSNAKTEVNITSSGPNASDANLDWHGGGLGIAGGGAGGLGRVLIDGVNISNVGAFTIARRTNSNGLLSIKDATFGTSGITIGFGEGTGERGQLLLDNATVNSTGQIINRNQVNASTEIRGSGNIAISASSFRNDGRVVADGGLLTIAASGGIASNNLATNQTHFGTSGWYAVDQGKLTLPGLTSIGAGKTWGEDPNDTTPDLVNSVRFQNVTAAAGTLNGSLFAADHPDVPAGLVNPIGIWDFSDLTFDSAELLIRYDDALAASLSVAETDLDLWHFTGGMWVDITGSIDTVNKRITSAPITGLSFFAIAEDAINATVVPEPMSIAIWLTIGVVGIALGCRWSRKR